MSIKNPRGIIYGRNHGYSCLIGQRHHGSTWMPKRFQARSRAEGIALQKILTKMSKKQLVTYLRTTHRVGEYAANTSMRKGDLVSIAWGKQIERLYPHRTNCDRKRDAPR